MFENELGMAGAGAEELFLKVDGPEEKTSFEPLRKRFFLGLIGQIRAKEMDEKYWDREGIGWK